MLSPKLSPAFHLAALLFLMCGVVVNAQPQSVNGIANTQTSSIWSFENTQDPGQNNILLGIGADSENDIWSVGDLISQHFDGNIWTPFPMVNVRGNTFMDGVAVLSSTDVWAVGDDFESGNSNLSVIQHFDGTQWSVVTSPHFSAGDQLKGVQAISANDIFAVGSRNTNSPTAIRPLVEHYDGTQWTVVATPPLSVGAQLNQIAIISASDMWAVGNSGVLDGQQPTQPFAMHFDGNQWKQVAVPAASGSFFNDLNGVTAIATNDVWAVGSVTPNNGSTLTLAEHWDGKKWRIVPTPNAGKQGNIQGENQLQGVSAISSTDVWASGFFVDVPRQSTLHFLIEHWDGKHWTISPAPFTPEGFDTAHAVLAFPSGNVYVAGSSIRGFGQLISIILHTTQGL